MKAIPILAGLILLLAACGKASTEFRARSGTDMVEATRVSEPTRIQGRSAPTPEATARLPGGTVAMVAWSGGFDGKTETLEIHEDGTVNLLEGYLGGGVIKIFRISDAQLHRLRAILESNGWRALGSRYIGGPCAAECIGISIIGGGKQISVGGGDMPYPPVLLDALRQFNELLLLAETARDLATPESTVEAGAELPEGVVAVITRSGAVDGQIATMTVHADATVSIRYDRDTSVSVKAIKAPESKVRQLWATVDSRAWSRLGEEYGEPRPDAIKYHVVGGGEAVIVTGDDEGYPAILQQVLEQANTLFVLVENA